jgi:excisionase family DNA binding protein
MRQVERGWLKVKEAAVYSGLSERTIRGLLKQGLRHSRLASGTVLIKVEWLDEYFSRFEFGQSEADRVVEAVLKGLG